MIEKLQGYLQENTTIKPIRAFQVLAGRDDAEDANVLQADGAKGFSTFMAYYILLAMSRKGSEMLPILKEYYGGMLAHGATTFWEDFDVDWLENSARIDKEIHAKLPLGNGWLEISMCGEDVKITAPEGTEIMM